jgi:putative MATE family efflux protein
MKNKQKASSDKFTMMTQMPVNKLICKMAVPTIITMLVSAVYNMADTYFVGKIGTSATGAVGVVFSFMAIIQACGFFFGHGSGNYMSRKLGEQKTEEASVMASTGFFSSFAVGVIIGVLGLIFISPLSKLLGSTDTILPYTKQYLFYILCGTPFMMSSLVLNNQLRFQGSAVNGMIGVTAGGVLNILLDPIFIFVFKMGVGGAGCATMLSQAIGFVILLIGCTKKGNIRISFKNFRFKKQLYKEIFRGGIPSLARQGLASLAMVAMNRLAGGYGDAAIAAMSIVSKIMNFVGAAVIGFGQGFQPVCGFNYGAKKFDRVKKAFWFSVKVTTVFLIVAAVFGFILSPYVIALFRRDDTDVIAIGSFAFRAQCISLPLSGFIVMTNMYLQTIGRAKAATLTAMSRQFLFFVPALFLLVHFFGLTGVEISQAAADVAAFLFSMPICLKVLNIMMTEENRIQ